LFVIAALVLTYRSLSRNYYLSQSLPPTLHNREISLAFISVLISLVAFCSAIFFLSLVYQFYLPLLTGLAIALNNAVEGEWNFSATQDASEVGSELSTTTA